MCPGYTPEMSCHADDLQAALYYGGRTWIFYSASYCWNNYKLGRLELTGSDPLSASSWTKYPDPVFEAANGDYGPGHNYFFLVRPRSIIYRDLAMAYWRL